MNELGQDRTVKLTLPDEARIIVAPDSFKGSLGAIPAAAAISAGWRSKRAQDLVTQIPQADGGEGTLEVLARAVPSAERLSAGLVTGPHGRPVPGFWLRLPDGTAVVELAQVSGITLMDDLDPLGATSRGVGEVIAAALDAGCSRLLVALGGSASTDAGIPALEAIGDRRPPHDGAILLTDVTSPLLGPRGAAAVFGPQKGAGAAEIRELEERLGSAALALGTDASLPGTGAAGGVAFGLTAWGARIQAGAPTIAELTGLREQAPTADLIITGEGKYDDQSQLGKVVSAVQTLGKPVALIAGLVEAPFPGWCASLSELAGSRAAAQASPEHWLRVAGAAAAEAFTSQSANQ